MFVTGVNAVAVIEFLPHDVILEPISAFVVIAAMHAGPGAICVKKNARPTNKPGV